MEKELSTFENFNENLYLNANEDVKEAVLRGYEASGYDHFKRVGFKESRKQLMSKISQDFSKILIERFCNICNERIDNFISYKDGWTEKSDFVKKLNGIGSDIKNHLCPSCGCHDRERHLKLYIEKTNVLKFKKNIRILHFAPEIKFAEWLSYITKPELHIFADIEPKNNCHEKINIERIPYSSNSFDLVIANHILEHVKTPSQAAFEINRVLKSNGIAIVQTPYASLLSKTFEDSALQTAEQRLYFYGQDDHVRLFGIDIFELLSKYLTPHVIHHKQIFDEKTAAQNAVNPEEPFFLYKKKE